jgi:prolyl-tRNA editing enzyme YbaK/EbsC (Cys-tRNA(Pro) deacylase)
VLSAARRFSSKDFKKLIGAKSIRFATTEEVFRVTGCLSGAVPPFGSMFNEKVVTCVDRSLESYKDIDFNCGLRTHSFKISFVDYQKFEGFQETVSFSEEEVNENEI